MTTKHQYLAAKIERQVARDGVLNRHSMHYVASSRMPHAILSGAVRAGLAAHGHPTT